MRRRDNSTEREGAERVDPGDMIPKGGSGTLPLASDPRGEEPSGRASPARFDPTRTAPLPKAREIRGHEGADRLLSALSSYPRPYLAEQTAESSGQAAAAYAGAARAPATRVATPPREPPTRLTASLVQELEAAKERPSRETLDRALITVKRSVDGGHPARRGSTSHWRFWSGVAIAAVVTWCGVGLLLRGKAHSNVPAVEVRAESSSAPLPLGRIDGPASSATPDAAVQAAAPRPSATTRSGWPRPHPAPSSSALPIKPTFQVQD